MACRKLIVCCLLALCNAEDDATVLLQSSQFPQPAAVPDAIGGVGQMAADLIGVAKDKLSERIMNRPIREQEKAIEAEVHVAWRAKNMPLTEKLNDLVYQVAQMKHAERENRQLWSWQEGRDHRVKRQEAQKKIKDIKRQKKEQLKKMQASWNEAKQTQVSDGEVAVAAPIASAAQRFAEREAVAAVAQARREAAVHEHEAKEAQARELRQKASGRATQEAYVEAETEADPVAQLERKLEAVDDDVDEEPASLEGPADGLSNYAQA